VLDRYGLVERRGRLRRRAQGTALSLGQKPNELWCTITPAVISSPVKPSLPPKKTTLLPCLKGFLRNAACRPTSADRKNYSPREDLRLPPLTRDLEIDDMALSFVVPQKVRFRYKLEGRDAAGKSQDHGDKLAIVSSREMLSFGVLRLEETRMPALSAHRHLTSI